MTSMISIILTFVLYITGGGSVPNRVDVVRLESRDSSLFIRFSEPINKEKAETAIKLSKGSVPISGSITFADDNQAAIFTGPTLPVDETLNITITTDLADEFGSQLPGEFSKDFVNTGADINIYDRAAPIVTAIRKIGPEFYITFNEEMSSTTTTGAVELTSAQGIFTGDCAADPEDAKTIRFTPGKALSIDVEYTVKVKPNTAADLSGKGLSEDFSSSFLNEGKDLFIYEKPNPNEHETSRVNNNCLFQGSIYHPELGLYYFRSRFYSPVLGRFLQPDPMGYQDSFNLYEAFNNNPLNYVDPYGMSSKKHGINPNVTMSAYSRLMKYYRSRGMSNGEASDQALKDLVDYGYIEDKSELKLGIAVTAGTGFFYNSMHYVTLPLFELSPAGIFKDAVSLPFGKDLVYGTKLKWWNYAMVGVPILYETFKIGIGLGLADEFLDIGDYVSKRGSSIWGLGPGPRGEAIEKMLGQNLPKNYPTIDRFDNGVVTSIKSMDLTLKSPMNPKYLLRTAKKYIDQVKNFKGARWARAEISANEISRRGLNLAIPRGIATSQQKAVLNQIIRYGKENNILVKIIEVD
jgi:RHS repeat-associated protein